MIKAGVKQARQHFTEYLSRVEKGHEVLISRRSEPIARIIPVRRRIRRRLESHKDLRTSIPVKGKALSAIVTKGRKEEGY